MVCIIYDRTNPSAAGIVGRVCTSTQMGDRSYTYACIAGVVSWQLLEQKINIFCCLLLARIYDQPAVTIYIHIYHICNTKSYPRFPDRARMLTAGGNRQKLYPRSINAPIMHVIDGYILGIRIDWHTCTTACVRVRGSVHCAGNEGMI